MNGYQTAKRAKSAQQQQQSANYRIRLPRLTGPNRHNLLAGTALASTLLIAMMATPTPAHAVVNCLAGAPASPLPIFNNENDDIVCVNTEARNNPPEDAAIYLRAYNGDHTINLDNSGTLTANGPANVYGIRTETVGANSLVDIINSGDITATSVTAPSYGIIALTNGVNSTVRIENTGAISAVGADDFVDAIVVRTRSTGSSINIVNSGDLDVASTGANPNDIYAYGIYASAASADSGVYIGNSANVTAMSDGTAIGIRGTSISANSAVTIVNSGDIDVASTSADQPDFGLFARSFGAGSDVTIVNTGTITATGGLVVGIGTRASGGDVTTLLDNRGDVTVDGTGTGTANAFGLRAQVAGANSSVDLFNSGDVTVTTTAAAFGMDVSTNSANSAISIVNTGAVRAMGGRDAYGISARATVDSVRIENSGSFYAAGPGAGTVIGIDVSSGTGSTIVNSGDVSASSQFAIRAGGYGTSEIFNTGRVTGFVELTEQADMFINQSGGVFEAKQTSLFGDGDDLFRNDAGGMVLAATNGAMSEMTAFEGLERFENRGTISMVDGREGDSFTISNTPGGTDTTFNGAGRSTLAVDAFLGAPGSTSDTLTIEGDVSGRTEITVNNTNGAGGALNQAGIPIVFATGATPDEGGFFLDGPIDAGFFEYDLFFEPTGSGQWELRSSLGAGAQVLPQLITASQDIWYQGSSVWFDRSADLRVLLARGNAPAADLGGKSLGVPQSDGLTPAVWVRGSAAKLDRDGDSTFTSFGRSVSVELERDLETTDFQMGLDLGQRNLLSQGDILVFGMLGGFVHGDLDYERPGNDFDFTGGQVGAYATYLKGGLFVDTLFNAHIYELDANGALGYPNNDLDANTLGLRTDAGYRFGSFSGGAFLEPLATLAVTWADIDSFSLGGNSVKFDNDANVRGRLGLRAGTTMPVWSSTIMEPFVTGSLWGHLAGDNQATLVSGGQTFRLEDDFEDVWGEVSAGVNFFNFSETTSVFAKVDVTFGDDVSGVGGKAGMRVAW